MFTRYLKTFLSQIKYHSLGGRTKLHINSVYVIVMMHMYRGSINTVTSTDQAKLMEEKLKHSSMEGTTL